MRDKLDISKSVMESMLHKSETDIPPFNNLIESSLTNLNISRFQYASLIQERLQSDDRNLSSKENLCALYAICKIGKGFSYDTETNVFSSYLRGKDQSFSHLDSKCHAHHFENIHRLRFHRPRPPTVAHMTHFVHTPYPSLRYQWLSDKNSQFMNIQQLFNLALEQPLDIDQERTLLSLDKLLFLKLMCETSPEKTCLLVLHNPAVAIEFFLKMYEYKCQALPAHHSAIANMDVSLHSMEVVYKLATSHKIDPEFLHVFIMSLFSRCGMSDKRTLCGREEKLIRLVAIFLQNLIQNEIIGIDDFVEIQAFCIEFSKVREVQMLFRLLKANK